MIWVKNHAPLRRGDYHYQHEHILYGWKPGAAHTPPPDRTQTTVWEADKPNASKEHPTMKPVELVLRMLRNSTNKGDVVLEPFGGSGSTLIACESAGRACRAVEIHPPYCDVIVDRWERTTSRKAEKQSGG